MCWRAPETPFWRQRRDARFWQRITGTNEPRITENCRSSIQLAIRYYLHARGSVLSWWTRSVHPYPSAARTIIGLVYNCRNSPFSRLFSDVVLSRVLAARRAMDEEEGSAISDHDAWWRVTKWRHNPSRDYIRFIVAHSAVRARWHNGVPFPFRTRSRNSRFST